MTWLAAATTGIALVVLLAVSSGAAPEEPAGPGLEPGTETFTGSNLTRPGEWSVAGSISGLPCLTAATETVILAIGALSPCADAVDADGDGALRLTERDVSGAVSLIENVAEIPSTDGLDVSFQLAQYVYGGSGDGLTFYLRNAAAHGPTPGQTGNDLGYRGMPGGLLAVGFDMYGLFSEECAKGVSARGAVADAEPLLGCGSAIDGGGAGDRASALRWVRIIVDPADDPDPQVRVYYSETGPDALRSILTAPVSTAYIEAPAFRFGLSAATGGATATQEIRNVSWSMPRELPPTAPSAESPGTSPTPRPTLGDPAPPALAVRETAFTDPGTFGGDWWAAADGSGLPCLTAPGDPVGIATGELLRCPDADADATGDGWLRLTHASLGGTATIEYGAEIPTSDGLDVSFQLAQYAGSADGFAFFLRDGEFGEGLPIGEGGGSLGYVGMPGAILAVGFDLWGGFSVQTCSSGLSARSGGASGYAQIGCADGLLLVTGPERAGQIRWARVIVDPAGATDPRVRVYFSENGPDDLRLVMDLPAPEDYLAATSGFRFGFSAATGAYTMTNEVRDVVWGRPGG